MGWPATKGAMFQVEFQQMEGEILIYCLIFWLSSVNSKNNRAGLGVPILSEWTVYYSFYTHLTITCNVAHKVNWAFLPLAHPLQKTPVRWAKQQSITLLILRPPQLQNTEGGIASLQEEVVDY